MSERTVRGEASESSERSEPKRLDEIVGGKYRIVRFLAAGGMGSVYEAQHTVVRRRFAVKFLHPDLARRRELLARFQREAEAAGALESENVAAAVDFGIAADGAPYIVLEYLGGESLEALLEREGHLPVERAANLVLQACRGVQAAHAAGIVHRDLKPHNLFVCRREDGTDLLKVLDFGVAKLELSENSAAATRTGTVLGTPAYMSPEQARGEKSIDHLSDVYALGAILYQLLSGKKPHPGESHNAILHHIATQPALPLSEAAPGLPASLVALVERALAAEPSARPTSADAFGRELGEWSRAEVWPAPKLDASVPRNREPSTTLPAAQGAPLLSAVSRVAAPSRAERATPVTASAARERSGLLLALGGGVVLVAVALGVTLGRAGRVPEPPREAAPRELPASPALPPARAPEPSEAAVAASAPKVAAATESAAPAVPTAEIAPPIARPVAVDAPSRAAAAAAKADRAGGRSAGRPPVAVSAAESAAPKPKPTAEAGIAPVKFDQKNPY